VENSRLIIAILLTMAVLFAWQEFLAWRYPALYGPKSKHPPVSASPTPPISPLAQERPPLITTRTPVPEAIATPRPSTISASSEKIVEIETDTFIAKLSSRGGRLISLMLKKYRATDEPNSPAYQMIRPGERMPLGMSVVENGIATDDGDINYAVDAPERILVTGSAPAQITMTGRRDGVTFDKSFRFQASGYLFNMTASATAQPGTPAPEGIGLTLSQPLSELQGYRDYPEIQAIVQGKTLTDQQKAVEKGVAPVSGTIGYAGFGDRYFLTAFIPQQPKVGSLVMSYASNEADTQLLFSGAAQVQTQVYAGPKALEILEAADPILSKSIDLGFWGVIALPFLRLLKILYRVVPNYGIAIILLTVLVRLVTLPMSIRGQRSMMKMQRLQPQVERIREKFKEDSERLNREMMELYKRNHVNPLGGCLPTLIQFPVFIGLYEALLNAVDLRHAPFVGWIKDLSAPDCLPIPGMPILPFTAGCHGLPVLVLLMTISTFVQQWTMPRQPDPNQQRMMMLMPIAFSLFFLALPAGLTLYYFASNLLGIGQQIILNREFRQTPASAT
jgi:YidC/Oxa1 family membrane protein insertase